MDMQFLEQSHAFDFHAAITDNMIFESMASEPRSQVSLVLEGEISFIADGVEMRFEAPLAISLSFQSTLVARFPKGRRARTLWCDFPCADLSGRERAWLQTLPREAALTDALKTMFAAGLALTDDDGDTADAAKYRNRARSALGAAIFAEYARVALVQTQIQKAPLAIAAVRRAIDEAPLTPWTIDRLAQIGGLNGNYLIQQFKRHVGSSPIRYVWNRRVEAGIQLLRNSTLSIEDIAYQCGFQTAAHFSRMIKQQTGLPPSSLRQARDASDIWRRAC